MSLEVIRESDWLGGKRFDVLLAGGEGFVLSPAAAADEGPRPWVWYAPTFSGRLPGARQVWIVEQLLAKGIAFAGVDIGESYGSPDGRAVFSAFYGAAKERFALSSRVMLLGQSRGALMAYHWAVERPDCVAGVAGIYPVCNIEHWPGVETACTAYGLSPDEFRTQLAAHNPIDRLAPLAVAGVPVFHVHGDQDLLIPIEQHTRLLVDRYCALGGRAEVLVVPGKGHEEVDEFFLCRELVDFLSGR